MYKSIHSINYCIISFEYFLDCHSVETNSKSGIKTILELTLMCDHRLDRSFKGQIDAATLPWFEEFNSLCPMTKTIAINHELYFDPKSSVTNVLIVNVTLCLLLLILHAIITPQHRNISFQDLH